MYMYAYTGYQLYTVARIKRSSAYGQVCSVHDTMESINSNINSNHPVKTKLTLFERSRKKQRADYEAQRIKHRTNLNDDSSEDPAVCPHWSGDPGELVMEMPLAKKARGDHADDHIAIDSNSDVMIFVMMTDRD